MDIRWISSFAIFVLIGTLVITFLPSVDPEDMKTFVEIVAIVGAGLYFLYRAATGFFLINLSLRVECTRLPQDDSTDYLVCRIHLKKGERGTLQIHDAQIRIGNSEPVSLDEMQRLSWVEESIDPSRGHAKRMKIQWGDRSVEEPFLNMTPGEEAEFARYSSVPRSEMCLVQVVLLGKLTAYPRVAQWRATCVSTPLPQAAESLRLASLAPSSPSNSVHGP
jgi:hypothetical protein